MAENKMIYFLAGYIYAQAEQLVKELYPTLDKKQFRTEVACMQRRLIRSLIDEEKEEG